MSTVPAGCGPVVALMIPALTTTTPVAATPPTITVAGARKFEPTIVRTVPPAVGPKDGVDPVTAGPGTAVGVRVGEGSGVTVGVGVVVRVAVGVGVFVLVGVDVAVGVRVAVAVAVAVGVGVRVGVSVGVGEPEQELPPSP